MRRLVLILGLAVTAITFSQQNIVINGTQFKSNLEIAEAQISKETIMLRFYEIDKFNPKHEMDNCTECPDGKSLDMDIEFNRGFKFPIVETDSVFIRLSNLQQGLTEYNHNLGQLEKVKNGVSKTETNQLRNNAEAIKAKGMEIAKLMQEGKISPQEAEKQLLALTQSFNEDFDNSSVANIETEEYKEKATYAFNFYNNDTLSETQGFSGYLWIKEFNKDRFVAVFRGELIEQCVEKRAAKSVEEEKKCKAMKSQYLPETGVLSEGSGDMTIIVNIKDFMNNR
jgi:hypothetical protein